MRAPSSVAIPRSLAEGDAEDPWLRQELAASMLEVGRAQEAAEHAEVAGKGEHALTLHQPCWRVSWLADKLAGPLSAQSFPGLACCAGNLFAAQLASKGGDNTTEAARVLDASGERPITALEAAEAAAGAYRRAVQALRATPQPTARSKRAVAEAACKLQRRACDALQQAAQEGASAERAAAVEQCAAEARVLGCAGGAKHEEL